MAEGGPPPRPLPPRSTIGILGGGQLGRMIALAGARLGFSFHVYCPQADCPAGAVAAARTAAAYDDRAALAAFAKRVDLVTYEFENIPLAAIDAVAAHAPVRPGRRSLEIAQDRLAEKRFLAEAEIAAADHIAIETPDDLARWAFHWSKAVLKTRREGYDGKGQRVASTREAAERAWQELGRRPVVMEEFIDFSREISVVLARAPDGTVAAFEPIENVHGSGHILATSRVPAAIAEQTAREAVQTAGRIARRLDHVGVLAVEFFVVEGETGAFLLVNEIAPRVHNSGHWTCQGASVSQFEQHVRAIAGWPLVRPVTVAPTEMTNLIGEEVKAWPELAGEDGASLTLYGKAETRPGRKMGHVTRTWRPG